MNVSLTPELEGAKSTAACADGGKKRCSLRGTADTRHVCAGLSIHSLALRSKPEVIIRTTTRSDQTT
jgi:hypothetical protein